jgi:hypothetical protein
VRAALVAAALGVVVLIGAGTVACRSRPPGDVGSAAASALASAPAAASSGAAVPSVPVVEGTLPAAAGAVPPARLRIPSIRVDATVDPAAVDPATNDFDVPPSVDRVGWYRFGPGLTAGAGSVVVAGHVDAAGQGAGAFFRLRELAVGARVELVGPDAQVHAFRVVARETYRKSAIPLDRYFARDGPLRLTLITCGGPFDRRTGHYRDNVVVTAEPVA